VPAILEVLADPTNDEIFKKTVQRAVQAIDSTALGRSGLEL